MEASPTTTAPERKGMAARSAANKRIIAAHQDEFDKILREEREARGLFGVPKRITIAELQAKLEAAEARIKELNG